MKDFMYCDLISLCILTQSMNHIKEKDMISFFIALKFYKYINIIISVA